MSRKFKQLYKNEPFHHKDIVEILYDTCGRTPIIGTMGLKSQFGGRFLPKGEHTLNTVLFLFKYSDNKWITPTQMYEYTGIEQVKFRKECYKSRRSNLFENNVKYKRNGAAHYRWTGQPIQTNQIKNMMEVIITERGKGSSPYSINLNKTITSTRPFRDNYKNILYYIRSYDTPSKGVGYGISAREISKLIDVKLSSVQKEIKRCTNCQLGMFIIESNDSNGEIRYGMSHTGRTIDLDEMFSIARTTFRDKRDFLTKPVMDKDGACQIVTRDIKQGKIKLSFEDGDLSLSSV